MKEGFLDSGRSVRQYVTFVSFHWKDRDRGRMDKGIGKGKSYLATWPSFSSMVLI